MIIKSLGRLFNKFGYKLIKDNDKLEYSEFYALYEFCRPYTMTSIERMYSLYLAVKYVVKNNIQGDFVECGVWKGGSSMLIALTLLKYGINDRRIWMYDTYEGMSEPSEFDEDGQGIKAESLLAHSSKANPNSVWCYSSLDDVKNNMQKTNYTIEKISFIQGKVEDTIPDNIPTTQIVILRLDTDWYESTKHEMEHLYPKLAKKGVLIIDDYGHWKGAKKAIDEFMEMRNEHLFLHPIDYTGRIAIKG